MKACPELPTRVARTDLKSQENWFCDQPVSVSLVDETIGGLQALAVGFEKLDPGARRVVEDVAIASTSGDPRIWPLKITRLVSSYGGFAAAYAASSIWLEEAAIGPWNYGRAAEVLVRLRELVDLEVDNSSRVEEGLGRLVAESPTVAGFGVPLRAQDERLPILHSCMARNGDRNGLPYWRLYETAASVARGAYQLEPHVELACAAALLDVGFQPTEIARLSVGLYQHLFMANASEGAEQAPEALRCLPAEFVEYCGIARRTTPKAAGGEQGYA